MQQRGRGSWVLRMPGWGGPDQQQPRLLQGLEREAAAGPREGGRAGAGLEGGQCLAI